ncbi:Mitochondrial matrix iron chaperone [Coemansia nantahalensis]|uniref:Mitochondrial matrix iron chaperone n=1 Tax=Coemansia helicoidea TaxID=1286919 RepID=A0ACC1L7Z3_9FUNG|nr:Mitochondrial matrix iron chaperone [Coemansia nantahalensis]KAJ2803258.1 Mitochondrial matrix iron chaperone [Coemansia helicoidea]
MSARLARALIARGLCRAAGGRVPATPLVGAGALPTLRAAHALPRVRRGYGTQRPAPDTAFAASALTDRQYDAAADTTMDELVHFLEDVGDRVELEDYDVEYSQGVLTLSIGGTGTYVINKQPPNKQIWLSSPVSGPERYDFDLARDTWFCRHTGESLGSLLARELSQALGTQTVPPTR